KGSPIDLMSHIMLGAHMIQMALLYFLVPIMLIRGLPVWMWRRFIKLPIINPLFRFFTLPLIALSLFFIFFSIFVISVFFYFIFFSANYANKVATCLDVENVY